jgi:hypothetical protein
MRELVLTCALAILGSGCVSVVSHIDEFDAGTAEKPSDASKEAEVVNTAVCSSGKFWTGGDTPSALHHPGVSCMGGGCHSATSKTPMNVAGTIYPMNGLHDDNDCNGSDGVGMAILLTDEAGMDLPIPRIQVNSVGNFYTYAKNLPTNFRAQLIYMGRPIIPNVTISDGNCNYCHTDDGFKGAKGRIIPTPP